MVFAATCEHVSSASIFASTNSDQICLASNEHLEIADSEQRALHKFSRWNLCTCRSLFTEMKHFTPSNLTDTIQPIPTA